MKSLFSAFSKFLSVGMAVFFSFLPSVFAGIPLVPNGGILPGPENSSDGVVYMTDNFLPAITNWIVGSIMAIGVIIVIIGGLMYTFSGGDTEAQKKARDTIIWGVAGVSLAILSYTLVKIVVFINFL